MLTKRCNAEAYLLCDVSQGGISWNLVVSLFDGNSQNVALAISQTERSSSK